VLAPLIQEALKLLRSTISSNIAIQQEFYDTQDCVLVNPIEIHEIVMNLCTNAYHAMEKTGGTLRVCLDKSEPGANLNLIEGNYCCLSISDTGTGIPPEIINNIFDPYFTTKEQDKGSGLGLSVVHGIIKKSHGAISVDSIPGKGTVFKIYLPITSAIKKADERSEDKPRVGGEERILFVDDEVAITKLGVRLLERLGYTVTGISSSIDAFALFKSAPDDFDLVITDMNMPKMVGSELAAKLIKIRPDIPIILCTGFSERIEIETAQSMGIRGYINKPILSIDLASKIREVLDTAKKENDG
jgi:CheY-like chemotaxis protein